MSGRVVVGVDGSEASQRALRWAVEEAAATNRAVQAVNVWTRSFSYGAETYWPVDTRMAEDAQAGLSKSVLEVAGERPKVQIEEVVVEGDPGKTLCALSEGADLLVVAARGRGGFGRMALGSVSTKCAHHARCPVVIVRNEGEGDPA